MAHVKPICGRRAPDKSLLDVNALTIRDFKHVYIDRFEIVYKTKRHSLRLRHETS